MIRSRTKRNEIRACKRLFKNGKFFLLPPKDGSDWKELFVKMAAAGAGRSLTEDGFPAGPWTPELLTEAISRIDSNLLGVDLRTVQLWFQDNDRGISSANIRWLARVFGCDDPEATAEWQIELIAAQARLASKRRGMKKAESTIPPPASSSIATTVGQEARTHVALKDNPSATGTVARIGLAVRSEALLTDGSSLDLPAVVFAGAVALGFLSFIVGINSVSYARPDGLVKQVGFLWAPNWTILFMICLPLFLFFAGELLKFWRSDRHSRLPESKRLQLRDDWLRSVRAYSRSFWAVFVVCFMFAGLIQWVGVSVMPLTRGWGNYAIDWGKIALVRPDIISVPSTLFFTGLSYLYMSACFYMFFSTLILLHALIHQLAITKDEDRERGSLCTEEECLIDINLRVMCGVFRCTLLGIMIAICMKMQSAYLGSDGRNIVSWLTEDFHSLLHQSRKMEPAVTYRMPTHYSSLLVVICTCAVFVYAALRLGYNRRSSLPVWKMSVVVGTVFGGYLVINAFVGFSVILIVGGLLALFGLFNPRFERW